VLSDFIIDTASGQPELTGIVTANGTIVGRIAVQPGAAGDRAALTLPRVPKPVDRRPR
jgi:hypothetical protein